eukprot:gene8896-biopygen7508
MLAVDLGGLTGQRLAFSGGMRNTLIEDCVELVGPLVIGADQLGGRAAILRADAVAAMAAGVVESADDLILAAHDDNRIITDLGGEVISGARDFAVMADEQPVAIPDLLHVELEIILIDIEGLLEAEAFAAVLQLAQYGGRQVHGVLVL